MGRGGAREMGRWRRVEKLQGRDIGQLINKTQIRVSGEGR